MSDTLSRARRFLGPKVLAYLLLGGMIGLSLFAVELAFAYGLQAFLVAIGALNASATRLPRWLPQGELKPVLAFIIAVGVLRALFNAAQIYLQGVANEELNRRTREMIVRWSLWSESANTAEVMNLYNAKSASSGILIGNLQSLAIYATSGALLCLGLLKMSPLVTLATGAGLGLIALSLTYTDRRALENGRALAAETDASTRQLVIGLKNLLLLQILGTQGREEREIQKSLMRFHKQVQSFFWIAAIKYAVPQIFGVALICFIAASANRFAVMPPGVLVSYFYLLLRLIVMFSGINQNVSNVLMHWPNARGLFDWFEKHGQESSRPVSSAPARSRSEPASPIGWKLSKVGFSYPQSSKPVFESLDLVVKPGETLVIIGPSGSGKSTLLSLLLGLLHPQHGAVELLFDGNAPVALEPRRAELLHGVGYVGPESFLLDGTIRENIHYGLEESPSAADIVDALRKAECGFIEDLPLGLEHRLSEQGHGLSAGQKQRLSLARALLRRPRALILDEATSNLDAETETKLTQTLLQLKRQMTIVVVTHRHALLSLADQSLKLGPTD